MQADDFQDSFQPGERITHTEFGPGVVLEPAHDGYLRAFFGVVGERRVPAAPQLTPDVVSQALPAATDGIRNADRSVSRSANREEAGR